LFSRVFDKVGLRSEDILLEDRIKGFDFNLCCEKLKICVIISIRLLVDLLEGGIYRTLPFIPEVISPVLLIDRVRGRECSSLVLAAQPVSRFKDGFISAKAP